MGSAKFTKGSLSGKQQQQVLTPIVRFNNTVDPIVSQHNENWEPPSFYWWLPFCPAIKTKIVIRDDPLRIDVRFFPTGILFFFGPSRELISLRNSFGTIFTTVFHLTICFMCTYPSRWVKWLSFYILSVHTIAPSILPVSPSVKQADSFVVVRRLHVLKLNFIGPSKSYKVSVWVLCLLSSPGCS